MKRIMYMMLIIILVFNLVGCQNSSHQDMSEIVTTEPEALLTSTEAVTLDKDTAIELYNEFLAGNVRAGGSYIDEIITPTGEPGNRYATSYAFFDSNGDGILDLHFNASRYYYVYTIKEDKIVMLADLSPYPHSYALNDGTFISHRMGAGPKHDLYAYYILNYLGDELYVLSFSKYDENQNGIYDDDDSYLFNEVDVTKTQWELLTEDYIYIDESGIEQIKNKIEWTVLFEEIY